MTATEARRRWLAARADRRQAQDVSIAARGETSWVYDEQTRTWVVSHAARPPAALAMVPGVTGQGDAAQDAQHGTQGTNQRGDAA